MKLDTSTAQVNERIYQVIATVHDPRTDEGMEEAAVHERVNQTRVRALQFADEWTKAGYWASVYNQRTGECVIDYSPKRDVLR